MKVFATDCWGVSKSSHMVIFCVDGYHKIILKLKHYLVKRVGETI